MLTINFVNDRTEKDLPEFIGHYDYTVLVNGRVVHKGRLENFNRMTGWEGLVRYLAETTLEIEKDDDKA